LKFSLPAQYFHSVFKSSEALKTPHITYRYLRVKTPDSVGLGFLVNKRLGTAVDRNKFKRSFRSLYFESFVKNNIKIAVIILPKTIKLKKVEIIKSFNLLKKHI